MKANPFRSFQSFLATPTSCLLRSPLMVLYAEFLLFLFCFELRRGFLGAAAFYPFKLSYRKMGQ